MSIVLITITSVILLILYKRYIPVQGIKKMQSLDCSSNSVAFVDVRHFHEMKKEPCQQAVHIPLPYLARHHHSIPSKEVVVIVPDALTRNLSIRQLKKYGYQVKGYWCAQEL
ncbi:rhodanese-like domain-containing protein [Metabacillus iocasae]|uniref:Rhodanese-related sulfurtransferase n=1 Tax=Priestia iocasae TaxID=2291674 RepID=A0ABS2QZR2_9BACI|nr:rhodanese-like domain-containing protein [Metabacillus iocasae]MBM7703954.1 rhodanese-related sulfurtransferase [Metabacillus iocasae]